MTQDDRDFLGCGRRLAFGLGAAAAGPYVKAALLGRSPRYAPDRDFDTLHIALDVAIDFRRKALSGTCRTVVRAFRDGLKTLRFDAVDLKGVSAKVDGKPARCRLEKGKLLITPGKALAAGQRAEVSVRYRVEDPKTGLHFVGPNARSPRSPVQVWSQSQPEDARAWFPCHDSPRQKATSELRITVPKGFRAISNGILVEETHARASSTYHWRMSRPHSIYLISLAVGRFSEIVEDWEGIPVTYYCEKGREADARRGFGKTVKAMDFFSKLTGVRYPYEKYAQVAAADYPGGMEHTTCTTQTDAILIDERAFLDNDMDTLVAHELAHQWFGDLVTCRDWSHAWLNESFATYCEVLFQDHDKGQDEADYEMFRNARVYFDEDARRYRRPIVCETYKDPWTLFDRHLYEKGAWVLHMLRKELGPEVWAKAVGDYLRRFRDASVETADFMGSLEESTGRNLKAFFDQWVFRSGFPHFRVQYDWDAKRKKASVWILQVQEGAEDGSPFKVPADILFTGRGWTKAFSERITEREHFFTFSLPGEPLNAELDPEHWLLKRVSFRKPQAMWRHQLLRAPRAQTRLEAAGHVAGWGDAAAVSLLETAARREPFWGAACEIIRSLGAVQSEDSFRALARLLSLKNPKARRAVVEALGSYRRPETARLLLPLSRRDPSLNVQGEALRSLGRLKTPAARAALRRGLRVRSYRDLVSSGALAGLTADRSPAHLPLLRKAAQAPNGFYHRAQAVRCLAEYSALSPEVVPWLCELTGDPDERLTLAAIASLGHLEDRRALPTLESASKSSNCRIRVYAEEALARIRVGSDRKK